MATSSKSKKKSKKKSKNSFDPKTLIKPGLIALGAIVVLAIVIFAARALRSTEAVSAFIAQYPGESAATKTAEPGLPAWLGWQHFLNAFFMLLIIRTGWLVRTTQRPESYWTRNNKGAIKTKGEPKKISMDLWLHFCMDALWVLNGIIFYILLFSTGQWRRVVPTSWDIFPNAASAAIQYASMNWPVEDGWVNYNALQVLAYFSVIFIIAPLSLITGLRMSNIWPEDSPINKIYPAPLARAIHLPAMIAFVAFIVIHVLLVFATPIAHGHHIFQNLSHMFAASPDSPWLGFIFFALSIIVMVAAWFFARPMFLAPIANTFGKVSTR